jgi:hypothetical protein
LLPEEVAELLAAAPVADSAAVPAVHEADAAASAGASAEVISIFYLC